MSASTQYVPSPTPDLARIQRALISVSDKEGLVELGKALAAHGVEILSTGGSAKALAEAGIAVKEVGAHRADEEQRAFGVLQRAGDQRVEPLACFFFRECEQLLELVDD